VSPCVTMMGGRASPCTRRHVMPRGRPFVDAEVHLSRPAAAHEKAAQRFYCASSRTNCASPSASTLIRLRSRRVVVVAFVGPVVPQAHVGGRQCRGPAAATRSRPRSLCVGIVSIDSRCCSHNVYRAMKVDLRTPTADQYIRRGDIKFGPNPSQSEFRCAPVRTPSARPSPVAFAG